MAANKRLCVAKCPHGYYGYNTTKKCQTECRADPSDAWATGTSAEFADDQTQICVKICSAYPMPTFGELVTHTCVEAVDCPG